jgi:replicative DNA helicase Mcm
VSVDGLETESVTLRHGHEFHIPEEFDEELMYLVGLIFGDGDISLSRRGENRGVVRISNGDVSVLRKAARIIEEKFGKEVEVERQKDRVPCIRLSCYTAAKMFDAVGMRTPKDDLALDESLTTAEHTDAFLRGLFDADGYVHARNDGGSSVGLCTVSEELAGQIQAMLETYGVYARRRERDRRGVYELEGGREIETKKVQYHVEIHGSDIDAFADAVGFGTEEKSEALASAVDPGARRTEKLPVGELVAATDGGSSRHHRYIARGSDPGRERAAEIIEDVNLGEAHEAVAEAVESPLRWDRVVRAEDTGRKEVFDLTVPETHNFVANGVVTHNTAAAVQDDFGDGKWTLEAGALVLADKGIACVDEVDKMDSNDRSALHEALEQQQVSIAKAGINATLKSRCSLLGAANPKYGRFDEYEGIAEQIDLEPALISRFDLIFTVTDNPSEEEDANLAQHILQTNYAGEVAASGEDAGEEMRDIEPDIDPELLRKYVAYARRECNPTMTDEARERIEDFYVDMRSQGGDGDAVPVTARKLEALVRLAEASARVRISDKVEMRDAERAIEVTTASLDQVGRDPETGEFDIDVIESGTSQTQRDRIKGIKEIISVVSEGSDDGKASLEEIVELAEEHDMSPEKTREEIDDLRRRGELIEPEQDHFRLV